MDKKKQIIAALVALILVGGIYFLTTNVKPKAPAVAENHDGHDHDDHEGHDHAPMAGANPAGGGMMPQMATPANFDSLETAIKKKLSPTKISRLLAIENSVVRGDVKLQDIDKFDNLGKTWEEFKQKGIAAHYYGKAAVLENSEKKLNFATRLFQEAFKDEQNPSVKSWMSGECIDLMTKLIALNPSNDSLQIDICTMMIDGGDVMNGVLKLREYSEKNPNNLRAQIILGKMSLQSNQLDKSIERGQKVLALDKNNLEAFLFMGEAYKQKGDIDKAIELFTKAKEVMNNPAFTKDVDTYIATFKK